MAKSTLPTLIKLAQQQLEIKQKQLAQLLEQINTLKDRKDNLQRRATAGITSAAHTGNDPVIYKMAGDFSQRVTLEVGQINTQLNKLLSTQNQLQIELKDVFATRKRYEIMLEREQTKHKLTVQQKQQAALDDITATRQNRA